MSRSGLPHLRKGRCGFRLCYDFAEKLCKILLDGTCQAGGLTALRLTNRHAARPVGCCPRIRKTPHSRNDVRSRK